MARYIDAEVPTEEIKSLKISLGGKDVFPDTAKESVLRVIDEQPTADVVEVKHGEWKRVDCGTICTNCHRVYDDFEFSYKQIETYFKRCPYCGAKMDGGKAE